MIAIGEFASGIYVGQGIRKVARSASLAVFSVLLGASVLWGQAAAPMGGELQVNSHTMGGQSYPAISRLADDGYVVVWQSDSSAGSDDSGSSIQGRRFEADGTALGLDLQINAEPVGDQREPSVAGLADGGFIAVWHTAESEGADVSSIEGRRFDAVGEPVGEQFQVDTLIDSSPGRAVVASLVDGGFVITWRSYGSAGSDNQYSSIQARVYGADGEPVGEQFQVNSYISDRQFVPRVAGLAGGGFVITWHSWGGESDNSGRSIQAQIYGIDGEPMGEQFRVNTYTESHQDHPTVVGLIDGGFVVAWNSSGSNGSDNDEYSVQIQRYSAAGTAVGPEVQVNSLTTHSQRDPAVAAMDDGGFVVFWERWNLQSFDFMADVQAQRYGPDGEPLEGEFRVNTITDNTQAEPAVAALGDGEFIAVWHSWGSSGSDESSNSIQSQRFAKPRYSLVGLGGKCLDVEAGNSDDGTPVNIYRCHGGENQRWQFDLKSAPQPIVGLGGKCLVPGEVDSSGDVRVVLGPCGSDEDDLWRVVSGGSAQPTFLVHDRTGLCLDVQASEDSDGAPTILFECHGDGNQTWRPAAELCISDSEGLCLNSERFRVDVTWSSFDGTRGTGRAVLASTDDSGLLWFFERSNWEMLVKVLDGCAINDRLWVFAAATTTVEYSLTVTDTVTGTVREYHNPLGNASAAVTDTDAFDSCPVALSGQVASRAVASSSEPALSLQPPSQEQKGTLCHNTPTSACLNYRFSAEIEWLDPAGNTGLARKVSYGTLDSGLFWFFNSDNWEMLVKVLDGCEANDQWWMLAAGTTDVEYTLRVTDHQTGISREYFNAQGTASPVWVDTFDTCP